MENERMDYATRKALVYSTADELVAAGVKPTMDLVRHKVGGSYSTLSKILGEWRRDKAQEKVVVQAAPEAVDALASRMAAEVWSAATSEAQMALAALRETLTAENTEMKQELAALIQSADALQSRVDEHDAVVTGHKRELEECNCARQQIASALQLAEANLAQREARIEELKVEVHQLRQASESLLGKRPYRATWRALGGDCFRLASPRGLMLCTNRATAERLIQWRNLRILRGDCGDTCFCVC
jgi:hypothetical protein